MLTVRVSGVVAGYRRKRVLQGIDWDIHTGVTGLLGPNGAGKTTLLSVLVGLLHPSAGSVAVLGGDARFGFVPQRFSFASGMRLVDAVSYTAWINGVGRDDREAAARRALAAVDLTEKAGERIRTLSGGERQRAGIAAGLAHEPDVLVLDEPTVGLDAGQRWRVRDLIAEIGQKPAGHLVHPPPRGRVLPLRTRRCHLRWTTGVRRHRRRPGSARRITGTAIPHRSGIRTASRDECRMRRSGWPLGPCSVVVPAVAIVGVVVGMTWPRLTWPYPLWVQTSAQFHQQFAFAGMIAGTAACWYATVLHPKDRIWLRPGAPRLGGAAVSLHLRTLTCWFVGAYLLALTPLVVSTLIAGGLGKPDPMAMVSGVLAMVAAVALGYALGAVVPSLAMVPVVAVGFYALLVAGNIAGEPLAAVAPVLWYEPQLGERESVPLLVFRTALFVSVAVAAAVLAAKAATRVRAWRSAVDVVVCLAVPAMLVIVSLLRPPVVYTVAPPTASCVEQREIRYCVHGDHASRLGELVRLVDPVIARFGTKPSNLDEVWDQALLYGQNDAAAYDDRVDIVWLTPDGVTEPNTAAHVGGLDACPWEGEYDDHQELIAGLEWDVTTYLETGTRTGSLAGMSVPEVQHWLARHQEQLHDCTLTVDQLPGARDR